MNRRRGFSLIEVLITTTVFVTVVGALLLLFISCLSLNTISQDTTTAINAAYAKLEEMTQASFETLVSNYSPGGNPGNNFTVAEWSKPHTGIISIIDDGSDEPDNITNNNLIQITITVCWQGRVTSVLGEDKNLDGIFTAGIEDDNNNDRLDSPAQIVTLMARH